MNDRDEARYCGAVMTLYADGKTIQYRRRVCLPFVNDSEGEWGDHPGLPSWDWSTFEYRVKPEPMEIEVWVSPDGRVIEYNAMEPGWTKKRFREVV